MSGSREAGTFAALQAERPTVTAKGRQVETEAAPIRHVAAILGVADEWLIALMVLCCDPLAIALTAAANAGAALSAPPLSASKEPLSTARYGR